MWPRRSRANASICARTARASRIHSLLPHLSFVAKRPTNGVLTLCNSAGCRAFGNQPSARRKRDRTRIALTNPLPDSQNAPNACRVALNLLRGHIVEVGGRAARFAAEFSESCFRSCLCDPLSGSRISKVSVYVHGYLSWGCVEEWRDPFHACEASRPTPMRSSHAKGSWCSSARREGTSGFWLGSVQGSRLAEMLSEDRSQFA